MTFFDFIVLGTFVLGLVNAFCLCMLTISVDRDIDDLKEHKANKDEWIFDVYFFEADPTDPFARSISND